MAGATQNGTRNASWLRYNLSSGSDSRKQYKKRVLVRLEGASIFLRIVIEMKNAEFQFHL